MGITPACTNDFERRQELLGRPIAPVSLLVQAPIDNRAERAYIRARIANLGHRLIGSRDGSERGSRAMRQRMGTGNQLVEDDAHGPQIAARIDVLEEQLLG